MKKIRSITTMVVLMVLGTWQTNAQSEENSKVLKTYVIEREIPEAGKLSKEQLQGISQKSCTVLREMDAGIEWLHSYVADNKVYCLYRAESEALIREHAEKGGIPVNSIQELAATISPDTAN